MTASNRLLYGGKGITTVTAKGAVVDAAIEVSTCTDEDKRSTAKETITDTLNLT